MIAERKYWDSRAKWLFWGVLVIFIVGSPLHFLYEWTGESPIIGGITPVNESVWEHLKLVVWTIPAWWTIGYFIFGKKEKISAPKWFFSAAIAAITGILTIVSFFYTHSGALGTESLTLDILSLLVAVAFGHWLGNHIYIRSHGLRSTTWTVVSIILILFLIGIFVIFTFYPPHLPIFRDSQTGLYGINALR